MGEILWRRKIRRRRKRQLGVLSEHNKCQRRSSPHRNFPFPLKQERQKEVIIKKENLNPLYTPAFQAQVAASMQIGRWLCPWHHCNVCERKASSYCSICHYSLCCKHEAECPMQVHRARCVVYYTLE